MKELTACVTSTTKNGNSETLARKMKYYFTAREFLTPLGIMLFLSVIQGKVLSELEFKGLEIVMKNLTRTQKHVHCKKSTILLQIG